jgi:hypothetical protein
MVGLQGQEELVKRKFNGGQSRRNFERINRVTQAQATIQSLENSQEARKAEFGWLRI